MSLELEISVPARGKAESTANAAAGERVAWCMTVGGDLDIGFQLVHVPAQGGTELVVSAAPRKQTDMGSYVAPNAGKLVARFDNTFSFLRGKSVKLLVARGEDNSDVLSCDQALANQRVMKGMTLFFLNQFDEAEAFFATHKEKVPIFNLCWATLSFFKSLMTWEAETIATAQTRIKGTQTMADGWMPREGLVSSLKGGIAGIASLGGALGGGSSPAPGGDAGAPIDSGLTERQLEATLITSESTMLLALLSLMEESLMALVRCGLCIRSGWATYRGGDKALGGVVSAMRDSPQLQVLLSDLPRAAPLFPRAAGTPAADFMLGASTTPSTGTGGGDGGKGAGATPAAPSSTTSVIAAHGHVLGALQFGVGAINALASVLPPIVMRVIAILGFPCDRAAGMAQLRASTLMGGVTAPLAALFILAMRVLLPSFHSGDVSQHVDEAEAVLTLMLGRYPDSALFLWMGGRLARMQGDVARATALLSRCKGTQCAWPQLLHLCDYELGFCGAFSHDWDAVRSCFTILAAENAWSKVFYTFMTGLAHLQQGRLREGRAALRAVIRLWASESTRKLGNKVISADQYALRRAVEFCAATSIEGETEEGSDDEEFIAAIIAASGGYAGPRLRLPAFVPQGSAAHAAALGAPCPLIGLECVYFFNGASQMDETALVSALAQVDAVLAAVSSGDVFDSTLPLWRGQVPEGAGTAPAWVDASESPRGDGGAGTESGSKAQPRGAGGPRAPAEVTASLDAAAAVRPRAWDGSSSAAAITSPLASPPASSGSRSGRASTSGDAGSRTTSSGGGGGGGGSGWFSSVTSALSSAVGIGGGSGGTPVLPAYARPTPLAPAHTATVAALVRGSLCGALGRIDEAAVCFQWAIDNGSPAALAAAGADAGSSRREIQAHAYARYELGVLYTDAAKVLEGKRGGSATAAGPGTSPAPSPKGASAPAFASRKLAGLSSCRLTQGLAPAACASRARELLRAARDERGDYMWKVRLHLRAHLTLDDLRRRSGRRSGWGWASWDGEGAAGDAGGEHEEAEEEEDRDDDDDGGGAELEGAEEVSQALANVGTGSATVAQA